MKPTLIRALLLASALTLSVPVLAIPDATGAIPTEGPAAPEGAMAARLAYNLGFEQFEKARAAETAAGGKAVPKLMDQFREARVKFEEAAKAAPDMKEAWNLIGYTSRRLGEYDRSLEAYEKALALNPDYPEAIEYRAEAYLALNRLDDAKTSYMTLFGSSRSTAKVLLEAMQQWVAERRRKPAGVSSEQLDAFAQWVTERATLDQQTAALIGDTQALRDWH